MPTEKPVKKIKTVDYTADIKFLFELHHEKISKKIMYLLPLLLIQEPDVKEQMVESYVNKEFGFCFPASKRTFSSDYKKTVKNILKKAILDGFDEAEVEYLLWGFILQTIPNSQIKIFTRFCLSGSLSIPDKGIPDIHKLLEDLEKIQARFSTIQHYKTMPRMDLLEASMMGPLSVGATSALLTMPLSLLLFLATVLLEGYLFTVALYSELEEKNSLAASIFFSAIIFDALLAVTLHRCLLTVKHAQNKNKVDVKINTNHALAGKLPDLVTVEIENEIRYMLPLFVPKPSAIEPMAYASRAEKEEVAVERRVKKKTRSSTSSFMSFFQGNSADQGVSSTSPKDIIKLDDVVYRRLYNKNQIPTNQFVGYTQNRLWELTQHENYDAFKALLDAPNFVPPKGHNGFVEMKKDNLSAAHFKVKVARSDLRLLFSSPKEAKVNGEKIHLSHLSGAKTHNQFGRR